MAKNKKPRSAAKSRVRTKRASVKRTRTKKPTAKKVAKRRTVSKRVRLKMEVPAMAIATNVTSDDIVRQATAAADEFNDPIAKLAAIEEPNNEQRNCLQNLRRKRAEIKEEAAKQILNLPAMAQALARLKTATANLDEVAKQMVNVTAVLKKANKFLGFGTDAVKAVKSVTGSA